MANWLKMPALHPREWEDWDSVTAALKGMETGGCWGLLLAGLNNNNKKIVSSRLRERSCLKEIRWEVMGYSLSSCVFPCSVKPCSASPSGPTQWQSGCRPTHYLPYIEDHVGYRGKKTLESLHHARHGPSWTRSFASWLTQADLFSPGIFSP